jgi:hypothetical protein
VNEKPTDVHLTNGTKASTEHSGPCLDPARPDGGHGEAREAVCDRETPRPAWFPLEAERRETLLIEIHAMDWFTKSNNFSYSALSRRRVTA